MNANQNLESIFAQAIELADPVHRDKFLDDACEGNARLLNRVDALLTANKNAEAFMSEPAGIIKLPDQPESATVGEQPGDYVGSYRLLQQIGEGGMGTVFMAEQEEPVRRRVALKIVKPGLDTKEVIARFESERQALAMMNHSNIARALDAGATQHGRPFFVMELVKGISITEYCNDARLTTRQRLELFIPVCHAIQHAHQKGIIHRDIKPRNVMITLIDGGPVPKVIDFGIAKATDHRLTEKTLFTRYGEFIGTPAYMSPEQAELSGIDVDTRSDVYSLGALLYELLAGVAPFDSEQLKTMGHDELRRFIKEETPLQPSDAISTAGAVRATTIAQARSSTPRELKSQVHGELDWIVMRALEKERARRYETASAVADDIQRFLHNEPVTARPPTTAYRWKKLVVRHRVAATAAVAIVTTLLLTTAITGWLAIHANKSQQRANVEAETLQEVVDFINNSLFAQANPLEEPNRHVKLRTVVDRAAQNLDAQPIHRPSVEAAIRTTIGETYRGLGEYGLSLAHLKRSHKLYLEQNAPSDRKSIDAANNLAEAMLLMAKLEDAKPIIERSLQNAKKHLANDDQRLLKAMQLDAWRLEALGEHVEAEKLLDDVLQRNRTGLGPTHPDTYKAMANLAYVLQSQQRFDESLDLLQTAYGGLLQVEGEWHPATLKVTARLAALHSVRGETDKAAGMYEATIPHAERLLGANHPQTLTAKHGLAVILFSQKQIAEAESILEDVLDVQRQQLGVDHPSTLTTIHNVAMLRKSQGRYREAESLLKEELAHRQQTHGSNHASTLNALTSLAFFYLDQAQFANAVPYYEQATALYKPGVHDDIDSIKVLTMLGLCRHKSGDHAQAKANLETAKQVCESTLSDHWLEFVIESLVGEVYLELDQRNEAEDALLRGYTGLKSLEDEIPARWKPLGLRAATRRLAEFYESSADDLRPRAELYRNELAALSVSRQTNQLSPTNNVQIGNSKDGDPN